MALTDVVGVNPEGLFDPAKYTTAGQPHLTEHLWAEYRLHLQRLLDARKAAGQPATMSKTSRSKAKPTFSRACAPATSRNASSIEIRSTSGVASPRTTITASASPSMGKAL